MPRWLIHLSVDLPCPAIVYAHYVLPTTLMKGLDEAKTHSRHRASGHLRIPYRRNPRNNPSLGTRVNTAKEKDC